MAYLHWVPFEDIQYFQEPVKRVSERAKSILEILEGTLTDTAIDTVQCARLVKRLKFVIKNEQAAAVIGGELYALNGCKLDRAQRVSLACSIAGAVAHASRSSEGGVLASDIQPLTAWVRISKVTEAEEATGERVVRLQLLMCNSVLAGRYAMAELRPASVRRWAKLFGLTGSYKRPNAWYTARQLADACFIVLAKSSQGSVEIDAATINSAALTVNSNLARSRSRRYADCHFGAEHDCGQCGIGRNQCERSCVFENTAFDLPGS